MSVAVASPSGSMHDSGFDSTTKEVYEIDPLTDLRWTDFVHTHPKASVFHSRNWLNALRETYGYEPAALCTSKPEKPITDAVVFCRVTSWLTGRRIVSLPFSDHCEPLVSAPSDLNAILRRLEEEVRTKHSRYLEIRPINEDLCSSSGLRKCCEYFLHTIDLSPSSEALFKGFDKDSAQRRIRRAEREELGYKVGNSEELLREFFELFVMTRRRHHVPPQPYTWFRHLRRCFGDQLQIRVISYRGRPISSTLVLKHGRTVTYKYGASDVRFNYLGSMPLLFWRTMTEAKSEGYTRFDLGRSNTDNTGLIRFKENWGARRETMKYLQSGGGVRADASRLVPKLSYALSPMIPRWSLVVLGKLLYRHVG
jgi:lipid II:glycine glycyltransferase (peptidoglycan interpeptide bridge formation enzyme)